MNRVKLHPTTSIKSQQHTTAHNMVCKRSQHVGPNNVASCCPTMLRAFARAFRGKLGIEVALCDTASLQLSNRLLSNFAKRKEQSRGWEDKFPCTNKEKCKFVLSISTLFFCFCTIRKWPIKSAPCLELFKECLIKDTYSVCYMVYLWWRDT